MRVRDREGSCKRGEASKVAGGASLAVVVAPAWGATAGDHGSPSVITICYVPANKITLLLLVLLMPSIPKVGKLKVINSKMLMGVDIHCFRDDFQNHHPKGTDCRCRCVGPIPR